MASPEFPYLGYVFARRPPDASTGKQDTALMGVFQNVRAETQARTR